MTQRDGDEMIQQLFQWSPGLGWPVVIATLSLCVSLWVATRTARSEKFNLYVALDGHAIVPEERIEGASYLVVGVVLENRSRLPLAVTAVSFERDFVRYKFWNRPVRLAEQGSRANGGKLTDYQFLDSDRLPVALPPYSATLVMLVCAVPQSFAQLPSIPLLLQFQTTRGPKDETLLLLWQSDPISVNFLQKRCPPARTLQE